MTPGDTAKQARGVVAGIAGLAGAALAPLYLAPAQAGTVGLVLYLIGGAVAGWLIGYLVVASLGYLLGWKFVVIGYMLGLLVLLGGVGAWAGHFVSGGDPIAMVIGALVMVLPNAVIFYATRDRWLGSADSPKS